MKKWWTSSTAPVVTDSLLIGSLVVPVISAAQMMPREISVMAAGS